MYLYELRNLWQLFFHVTVGAFVTLQIWLRQAQGKAPDYDVWHHPSDVLPWLWEKKEGGYLNCHCDGEPVHHKQEALLSFSPTALFVLSQQGMPVSMQYLLGKLLSEECWPWDDYSEEEEKTSLQSCNSARMVRRHWNTGQCSSPESLLKSSIKIYINVLRTKQELYNLDLPLWGISIDQIKRCHSKLETLCFKQMTCYI